MKDRGFIVILLGFIAGSLLTMAAILANICNAIEALQP